MRVLVSGALLLLIIGRFVVIDVKSGDYEVADRDADATFRLMARRPDAETWAERVGYAAAYRLGAVRTS